MHFRLCTSMRLPSCLTLSQTVIIMLSDWLTLNCMTHDDKAVGTYCSSYFDEQSIRVCRFDLHNLARPFGH